jgi:predicted nucleotidyltransferase
MLKQRILSTLKYFDLQDWPLTLLELGNFLIADEQVLKNNIASTYEVLGESGELGASVDTSDILRCLDTECINEVQTKNGFYFLTGRNSISDARLQNYIYGLEREKQIRVWGAGLRFVPFVRGVAIAGSQAMGQQKQKSDIDLLIITDKKYMWLARTFVTAYFQVLGKRRHGKQVVNRFCLNHYMSHPKKITNLRNLYTASEYVKLRPIFGSAVISEFQKNNESWIRLFFPQSHFVVSNDEKKSGIQARLEQVLDAVFGLWLNAISRKIQLPRIRQEFSDFAEEDELSFHPDSKQESLLKSFFI